MLDRPARQQQAVIDLPLLPRPTRSSRNAEEKCDLRDGCVAAPDRSSASLVAVTCRRCDRLPPTRRSHRSRHPRRSFPSGSGFAPRQDWPRSGARHLRPAFRLVMSLLVSSVAIGRPARSRCTDHRLATTTLVPSRLVCVNSTSSRSAWSRARLKVVKRGGEHGVQQLVRDSADGFFSRPFVELLGASVPEGDHVVHVAHHDRVMGGFKQVGLLAQLDRRRTGSSKREMW